MDNHTLTWIVSIFMIVGATIYMAWSGSRQAFRKNAANRDDAGNGGV
ncbi:MAG: hypothetical protein LBP75_08585 [Planctomycetota bacterium]|jgi:hypothetical protein|nr:hypothetical protein [Planctomycetota bacterium]